MGFFNTSLYTAQDAARANTSRLATQAVGSGEVQYAHIPYTLVNTEAFVSLAAGVTILNSTTVTVTSTTGVTAGMAITGTGIPLGATVASVTNSTTLVLSTPATAAGSGLTILAFDVINLCILPADAIPIPQLSSIACVTDPGTALNISVGSTAVPAGYFNTLSLTVPGTIYAGAVGATMPTWLAPTPLVADATPIPALANTANTVIRAAILTGTTGLTAGTVVVFTLAYKMPK